MPTAPMRPAVVLVKISFAEFLDLVGCITEISEAKNRFEFAALAAHKPQIETDDMDHALFR